jgi:PAS domain S-box-containing protein
MQNDIAVYNPVSPTIIRDSPAILKPTMLNRPKKLSPKEMEAEINRLWQREALFDATQQIAHFGYCEWDYENGRIKTCTREYARIFGMSIDEVIKSQDSWEKVLEQIHPEDRQHYESSYRTYLGAGSHRIEYRVFRKDGEIRHIKEVGIVVFNDEGKRSDSIGLIQDITEQRERVQDLENREAWARQAETITDIGHFIWDLDEDNYKYISPGFARIHAVTVDQYLQRTGSRKDDLADVHEEDYERLAQVYRDQVVDGKDVVVDYRIQLPDGEVRWIREQSSVIRDSNTNARQSIGVLQDINERKNIEQSLEESRDSLEVIVKDRTQKLDNTVKQLEREIKEHELVSTELENKNTELERYTYTVSHDLKSPLVTIKIFLGLLDKDLAADNRERVTRDIDKINSAADNMANMLDELLELSRIGRVMGDPVACNLFEIAQEVAELVKSQTDELKLDIAIEDMPEVQGDKIRLMEVYQNLIENAKKFMGDQKSPRVEIGSVEKEGSHHYFVRDNGIGIEAKYHDKIFDLFERLSVDVKGTGVGLTLVKRIIETHGGEIWIESEGPGQGSTIWFTLS